MPDFHLSQLFDQTSYGRECRQVLTVMKTKRLTLASVTLTAAHIIPGHIHKFTRQNQGAAITLHICTSFPPEEVCTASACVNTATSMLAWDQGFTSLTYLLFDIY